MVGADPSFQHFVNRERLQVRVWTRVAPPRRLRRYSNASMLMPPGCAQLRAGVIDPAEFLRRYEGMKETIPNQLRIDAEKAFDAAAKDGAALSPAELVVLVAAVGAFDRSSSEREFVRHNTTYGAGGIGGGMGGGGGYYKPKPVPAPRPWCGPKSPIRGGGGTVRSRDHALTAVPLRCGRSTHRCGFACAELELSHLLATNLDAELGASSDCGGAAQLLSVTPSLPYTLPLHSSSPPRFSIRIPYGVPVAVC